MSLSLALRTLRGHLLGHYRRPLPAEFLAPLHGGRGLELGGPSAVFGASGLLPAYEVLDVIDGVQPHAETHWHELREDEGYVLDGRRRGELLITGDIDLAGVPDNRYDVVFSSRTIEHIANPLRALSAWQRVTRPGGHLLVVAPHLEGTFDHHRPVTTLEHMIADREADTGEDDLTHLDEFVALHDARRNEPWTAGPDFERRMRDNLKHRFMHHHTFTTISLAALLNEAGVEVLAAQTRLPHDIYLLGRWGAGAGVSAAARAAARRSPFSRDRHEAWGRSPT